VPESLATSTDLFSEEHIPQILIVMQLAIRLAAIAGERASIQSDVDSTPG
jgi:hypothetical protein